MKDWIRAKLPNESVSICVYLWIRNPTLLRQLDFGRSS